MQSGGFRLNQTEIKKILQNILDLFLYIESTKAAFKNRPAKRVPRGVKGFSHKNMN